MSQTDLRKRIRGYEDAYRITLPRRLPLIIRVDGRAFHALCSDLEKPWDLTFKLAMDSAALELLHEIQGGKIAYVQSDEITVFATDYDTLQTEAWFGKTLQKMCSIAAATAAVYFNNTIRQVYPSKAHAVFDARCFVVPEHEVCNVFIDRQQDCVRNSILSLAQSYFSHKEMQGLTCKELQDKLFLEKGINWNDCTTWRKRGRVLRRERGAGILLDDSPPIFAKERYYIDRFVNISSDSAVGGDLDGKEDNEG